MRPLIVSLSTYSSSFNDGKVVALARQVGEVVAIAARRPTLWGDSEGDRAGAGYRVRVLRTLCGRSPATALLRGLGTVSDRLAPTVVHVESEPWQAVAIQSVLLARKRGVPVGVQFAENGPMLRGTSGRIRMAIARRVLRRCAYAIGWSEDSAEIARRLAPDIKTTVAPGTGVNVADVMEPVSGTPRDWFGVGGVEHPHIAFVGRFAPEKGVSDFLAIADRLAARIDIQVAIAGGDVSDPGVGPWLSSRPWARVHGVVPRTEVYSLLAAADVLVCPSRNTPTAREQFGIAAVEAMVLGTPVFAFDCGALREVVGDGGVIVREGAVDELVDELAAYLRLPLSERQPMIERARARGQRFTDSALADALINVWESIAPEPKSSASAVPP